MQKYFLKILRLLITNTDIIFKSIKQELKKIKEELSEKNFSEIISGSALIFIAKIVTVIVGLLSNYFIVKFYSSEILGALSIITSIISITTMLSLFGLDISILRFLPPLILKKDFKKVFFVIKKSFNLLTISTLLISALLFLLSKLISNQVFKSSDLASLIKISSLILFFVVIKRFGLSIIRSYKQMKLFAALNAIMPTLNLIILILITFIYFNKYNPIYSLFSSHVIVAALVVFVVLKTISRSNNKNTYADITYTSIIKVSLPMFMTAAIQMVMLQTDVIMLGNMSTLENVGIYTIVMKLALLSTFVIGSINTIIAPKFSELFFNSKIVELEIVAKKSTKLIFWLTLPLTITLIIFGQHILGIFGSEFKSGYYALLLLVCGQFLNSIAGSVGYFLNMTGYQNKFNVIVLFAAIINICLNIILIPKFGIYGAAFSSMISTIFWNLFSSIYIKKKLGFTIFYLPWIR